MFRRQQRTTASFVHNSPATYPSNNSARRSVVNTTTATSSSSNGSRPVPAGGTTMEEVLTPSFFQRYDALFQASSSIESAQRALQQATGKRNEVQTQLAKLQKNLQSNRYNAKEQKDRIEMVQNHWFYGTTTLQPQLWFRGGCQGKIDRARAKLVKAEQEYLPLLQQVQHVQTVQLAQLEAQVVQYQDSVTASSTAVALRTSMKERALSEYPSQQWMEWKDQVTRVTQERAVVQGQVNQLTKVSQLYNQAQTQQYQQAKTIFQSAMEHANRYRQLQQEVVPPLYDATPPLIYPINGVHPNWNNKRQGATSTAVSTMRSTGTSSKNGPGSATTIVTLQNTYHSRHNRIVAKVVLTYDSNSGKLVATNIPCPNNCGFLISPWHGTYCCGACQRGSGGGGGGPCHPVHHGHHHHGKRYPHQSHAPGHAHGGRCKRLLVSNQDGSQALVLAWNQRLKEHEQEMERQWKLCHEKLKEGHNCVQQGNALIEKALLLIPMAVQAKYAIVSTTQHMGRLQRAGAASSNPSLGLSSSSLPEKNTNKNNCNGNLLIQSIGTAMGWMEQCQSSSHAEASMFQRVKTQIQTEEISLLDQKLEGVLVCLQHEEDRLWNELRARAMIMAAPPEQPRQHAVVTATTPSSGSSCGCPSYMASPSVSMPHAATAPVIPIVTSASTPSAVPSAPPEMDHFHYHPTPDRPPAFAPQYHASPSSTSCSTTYSLTGTGASSNFSATSASSSYVRASTDTSYPVVAMADNSTPPWSSETSPIIIPMAHAVLLDS
jgi:hypothetical protein